MKHFDRRAEAAAAGGRGRRDKVPPDLRRAVQRALATGHRTLESDLESLDILWSLTDNPNAPAEQGPPQPGTYSYERGVEFFEKVAADIRKVRDAVSAVDFDPGDKQKFRAALKEAAAAWELRASAARSSAPDALSQAVQPIAAHEAKAASYLKALRPYLVK
jgi:hypothetical protein